MDAGFDSIEKIITMSIEDFKTVEGFKKKCLLRFITQYVNLLR